jgi:hypothetical protein
MLDRSLDRKPSVADPESMCSTWSTVRAKPIASATPRATIERSVVRLLGSVRFVSTDPESTATRRSPTICAARNASTGLAAAG